jgi:uncharacterized membrane protein HdeD (DUF308 family)
MGFGMHNGLAFILGVIALAFLIAATATCEFFQSKQSDNWGIGVYDSCMPATLSGSDASRTSNKNLGITPDSCSDLSGEAESNCHKVKALEAMLTIACIAAGLGCIFILIGIIGGSLRHPGTTSFILAGVTGLIAMCLGIDLYYHNVGAGKVSDSYKFGPGFAFCIVGWVISFIVGCHHHTMVTYK